jgi:hypothetical protein
VLILNFYSIVQTQVNNQTLLLHGIHFSAAQITGVGGYKNIPLQQNNITS